MELPINQIICGDCLEVMKDFPDESIDLVITSPPYNIINSSGGGFRGTGKSGKWTSARLIDGYQNYSDNLSTKDYELWQKDCLTEMFRLIPDNGAIFYNHKWRVQNGLIQDRHDIVKDFPVRQIIIWQRSGGINFNEQYFLPTYEVIYMICKPQFKLKPKANACGDVWKFTQEMKNTHPAPFPLSLPDRVISSTNASVILDPFAGSGTTAIASIRNNRKYIGIDISQEYCNLAQQRIYQELQQPNIFRTN